ncbi:AbrB family transcriptional regulator [Frigidibacter sp. SD6-1]|uniref:AbrB family transcriptional regulator n=1 Tax=Frigidibacter sp. SD6-1 TaxID=3032581 RepID=UPI0024DFB584|nr:AbrB family transcriptional regulator [Frigidibacter sp. SD6-1]
MSYLDRGRLTTFAAAAAGAALFLVLHLPLPLLLGPLAACLVAALSGIRMRDAGILGTFMRTFLGVAVGSSIQPATLGHIPDFALSLLFVPVFVLTIGGLGYPLFRRVLGFDHATAFYAAMPGGLQDMLIFGEEAGGNPRALSLIHATRVLFIVTLAPVIMTHVWSVDLTRPPGQPAADAPPLQIALMVASGFLGWKIAERAGLFGASILGPLILTAILSLAGLITMRPPAEIIWAAQFFIAIAVGSKYSGITWAELKRIVGAGLVHALLLGCLSLALIEVIHRSGIAPAREAFLAFLPGGQAEMVVIAIVAGADLAYVVSHHLLRIILVILLAPLAERWLR